MYNYRGFSTIDAGKPRSTNLPPGSGYGSGSVISPTIIGNKFFLADSPLVIRDFLNALNIRKGEKPGKPEYGTTIWDFVFDPNTLDVQTQLVNEIRRIASQDPRIILNQANCYPQDNGILLEVELAISPFNQAQLLSVFFNSNTNTAALQ
jgi:phage baseplate assembly protein W